MSISATYAIQTQKPNPPTVSLNLQLVMNSILLQLMRRELPTLISGDEKNACQLVRG